MSRVSKEQAVRNRQAVVEAASELFRRKGLEAVGVRELMAAAGLTQGAFTKQFDSKGALAAEACELAFDGASEAFLQASGAEGERDIAQLVNYYLSPEAVSLDCPMAMLAIDAARSSAESTFRHAYTDGLARLTDIVAGDPPSPARLAVVAAMVGAAILSKATTDEALGEAIKASVVDLARMTAQTK